MKSSIIAVGALILSVVTAQPHGHHKRRHAVYPRAAVLPDHGHQKREVVVVTDYVDIIETVHMVATVYVDKAGNTIRPAGTAVAVSTATGNPTTKQPHVLNEHSAQTFAPKKTPEPVAAPKVEETPAPAPAPPAPTPAEPEPVKSSSTTTIQVSSVAPKPAPSPEPVYVAPKVEEKPAPSPEPVYVAPKVEEMPAPAPAPEPVPAPVEVIKAPAAHAAAPAPAPVSGECNSGSPCSGDITFYQAGLGACGETHNGDAEAVVALPHGFMGTQSNGNPFCGRTVTIKKNGKTVNAKVVDKCMGCVGSDLDLSNKAFSGLGVDYGVGRTTAEWWFTS